MHFYRKGKKHHADLKGNFILSTNRELVSTASRTAGPQAVHNARYVMLVELGLWSKLRVCVQACLFILFAGPGNG